MLLNETGNRTYKEISNVTGAEDRKEGGSDEKGVCYVKKKIIGGVCCRADRKRRKNHRQNATNKKLRSVIPIYFQK